MYVYAFSIHPVCMYGARILYTFNIYTYVCLCALYTYTVCIYRGRVFYIHINIPTHIHIYVPTPSEKIPELEFCLNAEHTEIWSSLGGKIVRS